ncbi:MAG: DUF4373 domain-containing protein [Bacteroidaceae bacterium]|nr:DUF4373 domain-containing protein [Bacteroidaceae bacterium]
MYNYIPHPSNCRVSSALVRMLMREGVEGYGIYWMLLEILRDCPNYSTSYAPDSFAYAMHCSDLDKVSRICKDYGLFEIDKEGEIRSPWLCEVMGEYDDRKQKLREAGKRGAAHRWGGAASNNGEAIATPLQNNGEAIAFNPTQPNTTLHDIILPDPSGSPKVGVEYLEKICEVKREGFAPGYIAQVCMQYGMTEATCNFIVERSNGGEVAHPTFKKFNELVHRIQGEKWTPKHPDGFFLKKVFE